MRLATGLTAEEQHTSYGVWLGLWTWVGWLYTHIFWADIIQLKYVCLLSHCL